LSLVEASGPFLSLPVLLKTFPAGLDAHHPEHLKLLRSASEEWQDNQFGFKSEPAIHRAWVEFVLDEWHCQLNPNVENRTGSALSLPACPCTPVIDFLAKLSATASGCITLFP
jgi:hypothetical protein